MNIEELCALAAEGESDHLEFKRTTGELEAAARTICGMLNGIGGIVLIGVSNDGRIIGQAVSTRTREEIAEKLRRIEPPAVPDIETVALDTGKMVIAIRVPGGGGPFVYDGRPYMRLGPTTRIMQRERYERLLLERTHAMHRWENQPAHGIGIEHLDHAEIIRTIEEAIRRQRMEDPGTRNIEEILLGLDLIHGGHLLNAAVMLFAKADYLLPYYPQCLLRMARFRGTDKTEFSDNRQEMGHLFDLLVRAQRFLRDHLPVAGRIVPNLFERVDDPLYPPAALREALANALCHRDYSVPGGAVSIAIYDDRLEIASTGSLPFGLTTGDLLRVHQSRPWNPIVARVLFRRGIIESWGRGTIKIVELTQAAGLAPPEFMQEGGEVVVRFRPTGYVPPTRVGLDLTPLQRNLLEILAKTGSVSLRDIRAYLPAEIPRRTVQDNLQVLRQLGIVETFGYAQGARWMLKGAVQ
jgi:ATP-dependent DNA helicase RecG